MIIVNNVGARKFSRRTAAALVLLTALGLFLCATSLHLAGAQSTKVAATPPMGWNSWNKFGCNVSDKLIREMTDAIVSTRMKDAGYQFVNIDD